MDYARPDESIVQVSLNFFATSKSKSEVSKGIPYSLNGKRSYMYCTEPNIVPLVLLKREDSGVELRWDAIL